MSLQKCHRTKCHLFKRYWDPWSLYFETKGITVRIKNIVRYILEEYDICDTYFQSSSNTRYPGSVVGYFNEKLLVLLFLVGLFFFDWLDYVKNKKLVNLVAFSHGPFYWPYYGPHLVMLNLPYGPKKIIFYFVQIYDLD